MQQNFKQFFMKNAVLICSVALGASLWLVNAVFNFAAKDYSALGVNIAYIICLISMAGAFFAGNMIVVQGMIAKSPTVISITNGEKPPANTFKII